MESASTITSIELSFAKRVTEKMKSYPIAFFFLSPVDPTKDGIVLSDYLSKISPNKPMDLGTVTKHIESETYKTIDEWKHEMNTIWNNALKFNPEHSPYHIVAAELKRIFGEKTVFIPRTAQDEWYISLRKAARKMEKESKQRLLYNYTPASKPLAPKKS